MKTKEYYTIITCNKMVDDYKMIPCTDEEIRKAYRQIIQYPGMMVGTVAARISSDKKKNAIYFDCIMECGRTTNFSESAQCLYGYKKAPGGNHKKPKEPAAESGGTVPVSV